MVRLQGMKEKNMRPGTKPEHQSKEINTETISYLKNVYIYMPPHPLPSDLVSACEALGRSPAWLEITSDKVGIWTDYSLREKVRWKNNKKKSRGR